MRQVPLRAQHDCWSLECPVSAVEFDIREWMRENNVTLPVNDPVVRAEVVKLLRRDLTAERLAAYAESRQRNQGRTVHRNADEPTDADAATA
jgi:hypothetical protein